MAGFKSRKEKPVFDKKLNTENKERTYFYTPDIEGIRRRDKEIHFLRIVSFTTVFTALIILAYYRWKVDQLEKTLKIKDEHYIGTFTGGVVLTGEDNSMYAQIMDQFVSLIYVITILVAVITWCIKISEY
ncbi:hypothetical protein BOTCAL_0507g00060 [Botryotinia calthae]|uniref:Uncharacterized protein n=1 Tax=Botryotinia calthae TaxID=38488 RepID=A0A4Y8CP03_9HELO|nr:hypothetical protein BOTCAL_0507g00060 [Botryotinia calthae]